MENVSAFKKNLTIMQFPFQYNARRLVGKIHVFAQIKEKYLGIIDIYSMRN